MEIVTDPILRLHLTGGSNSSMFNEHKFSKSLTIKDLKDKLEIIMGVTSNSMKLQVFDTEDKPLFWLNDDSSLLGSFHIDDGMRINVTGSSLISDYSEGGDVPKFELADDEYDKKRDSVRDFLRRNKKGKYDPEFQKKQAEMAQSKEEIENKYKEEIKAGMRCKVSNPKQPPRRGEVMFVGYTDFKPDLWVGVRYDEPFGKNDGSVAGKKYFSCPMNYGSFVRPKFVEVGDFGELDIDDELDEM